MMLLDRRLITQFDWGLLSLTLLIPFCGLIVLYSAGYDPELSYAPISWLPIKVSSAVFMRQLYILGFGLVCMLVCLAIPGGMVYRYSYVFYGACIAMLLVVLIIGEISKGSQRWLSLGGIRFQPSEPMKLGLILALSRYLVKNPPKADVYSFRELFFPALIIGVPVLLIIKQPDLGTALSIGAIGVSMVLFVGVRIKTIAWICGSACCALIPAWHLVLKPYQKRRVLSLLNPDADPLGSGYHIIQSKIAVGSGAVFGKGFLKGTQTQLEFLPEHT
ncbi:MAG: rod shape-determining protein RodA, partial [Bdellovibrionales bacterium]|nr:rod shape-determining protein RodA [Bdellovibrionales bacterium]